MKLINEIQKPIIISGPCSAETEDQMMQTALRLKATGKVDILRAGIWKPRTRPNAFEGVGEEGLRWLVDAGKETDLPVITEVANAKHVELALKAGFKKLWLGARTSVNPFTVQEIADSVRGIDDIDVLIKNPINPDIGLWIGAIERFYGVGVKNVHAIHRGFSSLKSKKYRNKPMWEIPLQLKKEFPEVKMICDPSHICGNRELLQKVSQKSMDLVYEGLMIESHITPDDAWSDAKQQITPERLGEIVDSLILRTVTSDDKEFKDNLETLRSKINEIDAELIDIIVKRMGIAEEIGNYKKDHNITILQPDRWDELKKMQVDLGGLKGLSESFMAKYSEAIHQESIRHQTAIMNKK
jgi:chorismate mutase